MRVEGRQLRAEGGGRCKKLIILLSWSLHHSNALFFCFLQSLELDVRFFFFKTRIVASQNLTETQRLQNTTEEQAGEHTYLNLSICLTFNQYRLLCTYLCCMKATDFFHTATLRQSEVLGSIVKLCSDVIDVLSCDEEMFKYKRCEEQYRDIVDPK